MRYGSRTALLVGALLALTACGGGDDNEGGEGDAPASLSMVENAIDADPGEYTMFCEFHREAGMEGTVTVQ